MISRFELKPITITDEVRAGGRIPLMIGRALTDKVRSLLNLEPSSVFLGSSRHWRRVEETLCTFFTSKKMIEKHWNKFVSMCQFEHYPFEQPLHEIYKTEYCLSPIPSLAIHCTNINSIYGLSPNMDWGKIWEENKDY